MVAIHSDPQPDWSPSASSWRALSCRFRSVMTPGYAATMQESQERHWTAPEPPALTISQPWAHAIIFGQPPKDVENRTWSTTWRGRLYIHASRSDDPQAPGAAWAAGNAWHEHTHGAIIGYVTIKDCVRSTDPGGHEASPWAEEDSPWHWLLADPVALSRPLPCQGKLGLWRVSLVQLTAMRALDPDPV